MTFTMPNLSQGASLKKLVSSLLLGLWTAVSFGGEASFLNVTGATPSTRVASHNAAVLPPKTMIVR